MEFGKYLVLSTVHVRYSTSELLNAWAYLSSTARPLPVASTEYGWFIPTRALPGKATKLLPEELPSILALAREWGCEHVLFDCDGPIVADLPQFAW